jgi:hypothetical protein
VRPQSRVLTSVRVPVSSSMIAGSVIAINRLRFFLASCRECLAEREVQVAHAWASHTRPERVNLP